MTQDLDRLAKMDPSSDYSIPSNYDMAIQTIKDVADALAILNGKGRKCEMPYQIYLTLKSNADWKPLLNKLKEQLPKTSLFAKQHDEQLA